MRPPRKIYISKMFAQSSVARTMFEEDNICYVRQNSELKKLERWIQKTYYWQAPQTMNILKKIKQMKGE